MIGERLKEERLRIGLSQTEFAKIIGKTKQAIVNYESGNRSICANDLSFLASKLNIDVFYVLIGERNIQSTLSSDEISMINTYRNSDFYEKTAIRSLFQLIEKPK